jgi:MYXO-CTERM domain-containing protein
MAQKLLRNRLRTRIRLFYCNREPAGMRIVCQKYHRHSIIKRRGGKQDKIAPIPQHHFFKKENSPMKKWSIPAIALFAMLAGATGADAMGTAAGATTTTTGTTTGTTGTTTGTYTAPGTTTTTTGTYTAPGTTGAYGTTGTTTYGTRTGYGVTDQFRGYGNTADGMTTRYGNYRTYAATNTNNGSWGWLGLIGLAGLFGLRSNDRKHAND